MNKKEALEAEVRFTTVAMKFFDLSKKCSRLYIFIIN